MPKRSAQYKLEKYKRKIRKLEIEENKLKNKEKQRRRIRTISDSSDDENSADIIYVNNQDCSEPQDGSSNQPYEEQIVASANDAIAPEVEQDAVASSGEMTADRSLDPELLSALGASTSDTPDFGVDIHESLANLWTPLLKKGLAKDDKEKLFKEYLIPGNCKLLQAPKLNAEITAAVSDIVRGRDKKLSGFQQSLGTGITAVNKAMDILLSSDNKVLTLKYLSDGCRILIDLHHALTKDRMKLITPSLDKSFLHVINETERDDTLFGQALSEKIKASKAIEKQSSLIRKAIPHNKMRIPQPSTTRPVHQGNWSGPPRYPSNRGGRGGLRRPAMPAKRNFPPQAQTRSFNPPKHRVPHQQ